MPPALKISRFISNGPAQSGKLIKVCSRACTERAATAQRGCCCSVQARKWKFVLLHFHVKSRHVHIPPLRRRQSVSGPATPSMKACTPPQSGYHWWKDMCNACMKLQVILVHGCKPVKAHDITINYQDVQIWLISVLWQFPQFQYCYTKRENLAQNVSEDGAK